MKIAHCLFTMETGGSQVLAVELMNEMCINHDVSLIIINNKWNNDLLKQLNNKVKIFYVNRTEGSRNPIPIIKLNLLLLRLKPDIIHCHEPKAAAIIKLNQAKLLHTVHDVGLPTSFYHLYNLLVAISETVYNDVTSRCDVPVKKVDNGIPVELFTQRKNYVLEKGESIKLVQVSRLVHEKKGQDILLYALSKIRYDYGFSDFSIDFIGSGNSYQFLMDLVTELNLNSHVNFAGERSREWLFANLSDYHILIQPSLYEGFGLTVLEGFAAGLPVLASKNDGPAEIISRTPGGFLFDNGNSLSCAKELHDIFKLYKNGSISDLMDQTIPVIKREYSIKSCSEGYLKEYSLLMNSQHASPVLV